MLVRVQFYLVISLNFNEESEITKNNIKKLSRT